MRTWDRASPCHAMPAGATRGGEQASTVVRPVRSCTVRPDGYGQCREPPVARAGRRSLSGYLPCHDRVPHRETIGGRQPDATSHPAASCCMYSIYLPYLTCLTLPSSTSPLARQGNTDSTSSAPSLLPDGPSKQIFMRADPSWSITASRLAQSSAMCSPPPQGQGLTRSLVDIMLPGQYNLIKWARPKTCIFTTTNTLLADHKVPRAWYKRGRILYFGCQVTALLLRGTAQHSNHPPSRYISVWPSLDPSPPIPSHSVQETARPRLGLPRPKYWQLAADPDNKPGSFPTAGEEGRMGDGGFDYTTTTTLFLPAPSRSPAGPSFSLLSPKGKKGGARPLTCQASSLFSRPAFLPGRGPVPGRRLALFNSRSACGRCHSAEGFISKKKKKNLLGWGNKLRLVLVSCKRCFRPGVSRSRNSNSRLAPEEERSLRMQPAAVSHWRGELGLFSFCKEVGVWRIGTVHYRPLVLCMLGPLPLFELQPRLFRKLCPGRIVQQGLAHCILEIHQILDSTRTIRPANPLIFCAGESTLT